MSRSYLLRTFGCQMNEHDSERIAGLLFADGYVPTEEAARAEVVVFNTCAIRENADNKLYGNLGHLKPFKDRNPELRIVVAGCLAQKDQGQIQRKAPWVDVVVGTHALPHLLEPSFEFGSLNAMPSPFLGILPRDPVAQPLPVLEPQVADPQRQSRQFDYQPAPRHTGS